LLFDPKNAAKLKDCGIMIVDSPEDVLPSVLIYLGKDPTAAIRGLDSGGRCPDANTAFRAFD